MEKELKPGEYTIMVLTMDAWNWRMLRNQLVKERAGKLPPDGETEEKIKAQLAAIDERVEELELAIRDLANAFYSRNKK